MAINFQDGKYVDENGRVTLDPTVYKDWQIAEEAEKTLPSVEYFREKLGLLPDEIIPYGKTPKLDFMNERLSARAAALREKGVSPKLAIVRCGENPSDLAYEKGAVTRCEAVGVEVEKFVLPEDVTKQALIAQIEAINRDDSIHGCLLFRPLPKHLKADQDEICNCLAAKKDVDCMTDLSNAGVFMGKKLGFAPCTPQACMEILDYYGIDCKGKNAVVIGRSLVVGKPAAMVRIGPPK